MAKEMGFFKLLHLHAIKVPFRPEQFRFNEHKQI